MMTFEEGLPDHFIIFSQTPKAQEHIRRIFARFCLFLLLPFLGIVLVGASFLSLILLGVLVGILVVGWSEWQ
ncbi:MAG: hypothetical protein VX998_06170, partial [Candidatus Thermoplasmatota archaeon]|nr:hypothetical protein [Candidatus Thermoplasmatota archaeon]